MSTNGQESKDQHFIPKFYLKGFTDRKGSLWVYEKFRPLRESKPKHEAHRPDYYTHTDSGKRDETIEDLLKTIESQVAPIVRKLANPQYVLTAENSEPVVVFASFMFARVPAWREYLNTVAVTTARNIHRKTASNKLEFERICADFESKSGKNIGSYEEARKNILEGDYELTQESVAFNLGSMMKSASFIMDTLANFDYQVLYAPAGKFFLTSDSPVFTLRPEKKGEATIGMGFGWPGVEVYFPMNKRACLKLKKGQRNGGFLITEGFVDEINRLTMATATNFLYGNEGLRRIARLFDERGCRTSPGKDSFLSRPPPQYQYLNH